MVFVSSWNVNLPLFLSHELPPERSIDVYEAFFKRRTLNDGKGAENDRVKDIVLLPNVLESTRWPGKGAEGVFLPWRKKRTPSRKKTSFEQEKISTSWIVEKS